MLSFSVGATGDSDSCRGVAKHGTRAGYSPSTRTAAPMPAHFTATLAGVLRISYWTGT